MPAAAVIYFIGAFIENSLRIFFKKEEVKLIIFCKFS